ncbi:acid phosphatase [Tsuneonella deserti]|uniref:Acid phosphatase n=1 Tax=Tsuneonella deserti TaxID=2035528 RepID=A0ABQ1SA93_9SPHN|nr:phosphatase PAP2 family protein [Tsuneonella deserti]GGE02547.1 acid phosphatase [Tsuneonella deserti]
MNRIFACSLVLLVAGCTAAAPESAGAPVAVATPSARAAFDMGPAYFPGPLPAGETLVGAPPAAGSEAMKRDEALSAAGLALHGTERFRLSAADANLGPGGVNGAFSCTAGVAISDAATPAIMHLLRRATADFGTSTSGVKARYNRARPFTVNDKPTCDPASEEALRHNGSYPSGHSAIGYGAGLLLAAVFPDKAAALTRRGIEFGESRRVCNVHWESDVEAGRVFAAATFARLQSDPAFREDLARAQAEAKGSLPAPTSCAAEAAALAQG